MGSCVGSERGRGRARLGCVNTILCIVCIHCMLCMLCVLCILCILYSACSHYTHYILTLLTLQRKAVLSPKSRSRARLNPEDTTKQTPLRKMATAHGSSSSRVAGTTSSSAPVSQQLASAPVAPAAVVSRNAASSRLSCGVGSLPCVVKGALPTGARQSNHPQQWNHWPSAAVSSGHQQPLAVGIIRAANT